jgi:hypothetical protein
VPPMTILRPCGLVSEFPTGRRMVFNGGGRLGSEQQTNERD